MDQNTTFSIILNICIYMLTRRECLSDELLPRTIMILTPIMPTKLKSNLHLK
ncbi:hypothetical protein JHK87_030721 [Glycine soja]|nr:hypothetical protein JHK87_030721 [Glycine soja]